MSSLKQLILEDISGLSDFELIKKYLVDNNLELEGIALLSDLAAAKAEKAQKQLDYARTWIPNLVDIRDYVPDRDVERHLNWIAQYTVLRLDLPDYLVEWAKATVPTLKVPQFYFMPAVQLLKDKYNISFKE